MDGARELGSVPVRKSLWVSIIIRAVLRWSMGENWGC
jgi:hypothetical protein